MFKLKVPKEARSQIKEKLKIVNSKQYDYVLTTDSSMTEDDKINIVFSEKDMDKMDRILDAIIQGEDVYITGENQKGIKHLESRKIQYFMVEDEEVRAYLKQSFLSVKYKLYELEGMLKDKHFIRVSKYALVNINKIDYIKPAFNSKLLLHMNNGDQVEVNRRYYKTFKKTLKI